MNNIVILGAGALGQALKAILNNKKIYRVQLWDKNPNNNLQQKKLSELLPSADFIFLAVPSWAFRGALLEIKPLVNRRAIIIGLSKGIERKSQQFLPQIFEEILGSKKNNFVMLSGPMLAEEITQGLVSYAIVASINKVSLIKTKKLFNKTTLRLVESNDVIGIAIAGVLKNIYAIGLGMAEALNLGANFNGWYITQAIDEMEKIIVYLKGEKKTVYSLAGLGDLVATGFSSSSRNHQIGVKLIKTNQCCLRGEGFVSLPSLVSLLQNKIISQLPILSLLIDVLLYHKDAETAFQRLLRNL